MKVARYNTIDLIRAISIIGVIIIHTLSFHLNSSSSLFFWNALQFVVGTFVFCSGYVHAHYLTKLSTLRDVFLWYKKRFTRILVPFYIYFVIHFIMFLFFPEIFTHFGMHPTWQFFLNSILLYGGINTNWLPLLFLELTAITPFIFWLYKKKLLSLYIIFACLFLLISSIFLLPYGIYKAVMWIGWSLIFIVGLFSSHFQGKNREKIFLSLISFFSLITYVAAHGILLYLHRAMNFTDNKYPPTIYYISYAIGGTGVLFLLSTYLSRSIPSWTYNYISRKSYALFFIHFIILDIVLFLEKISPSIFSIPFELIITIGLSVSLLLLIDYIQSLLKNYSFTAYTTSRVE